MISLKNESEVEIKLAKIIGNKRTYLIPTEYYLKSFDTNFKMQTHSHKYYEIMYAEKGDFYICININNTVFKKKVCEWQFVFLDSDAIHCLEITEKTKICNIEINQIQENTSDKLNINQFLADAKSFQQFKDELNIYCILNDTEKIIYTLKSIHSSLGKDSNNLESFYHTQSLMLSLLIDIGRCYINTINDYNSIYTIKAIEIIKNHLDQPITPKLIAKKLFISQSYLYRIFKPATGCTIVNYINNLRIEHSKTLLENTKDSIIDVAIAVGFNTRQNFTKLFYNATKMSPGAYRKQYQSNEYSIAKIPKQQEFYETKKYAKYIV